MEFSLAAAKRANATATNAEVGALGLLAKVPFLLILDTLERCAVAEAEQFWFHVEAAASELTRPELFSKGSLPHIYIFICMYSFDAPSFIMCFDVYMYVCVHMYICMCAGKLTVLRFCNALLRRLSKSSNTEVLLHIPYTHSCDQNTHSIPPIAPPYLCVYVYCVPLSVYLPSSAAECLCF
jgi:hypothetical protein